jgi:UDP-N-acetylmuramoyl-tripeptide--D-alanyl-D-alanine ligase
MENTLSSIAQILNGRLRGGVSDRQLLVSGVSTDTRGIQPNQLYIPLVGERFDGHRFVEDAAKKGAAAALWQEDRPLPDPLPLPLVVVNDTLQALQALAAAYRRELGIPVVAVTGSNGKTTTKDLISSVLSVRYRVHRTEGNLNNHIGLPLTLLSMPRDTEIAVVEMGMNHAGEIALLSRLAAPDAAVITNVGEAHIEYLGSREAIADAKLEIREGLSSDGVLVYHGDEPLLRERLAAETRRTIAVGLRDENDEQAIDIRMEGTTDTSFTSRAAGTRFRLPLPGCHNAVNALFALVLARYFGMTEEEIQEGFSQVKISGMRLEQVTAQNGMRIINDAYNASPTSMRAVIDLLVTLPAGMEKWALLGDILELGPEEARYHREVGRYAVEKGVDRVYTIGEKGRWIAEGAKKAAGDTHIQVRHFQSAKEAIDILQTEGNPDTVLLVKASRGARLEGVVEELIKGEKES